MEENFGGGRRGDEPGDQMGNKHGRVIGMDNGNPINPTCLKMDPLKGEMLLVSEMLAEEEDMPRVQDCIVHNMLKRRRRTFLARGHRIDQLSFLLFPMVGSPLSSR